MNELLKNNLNNSIMKCSLDSQLSFTSIFIGGLSPHPLMPEELNKSYIYFIY